MKICLIAIGMFVEFAAQSAFGATYSMPLTLETEVGAHGEYRVAAFDFGVEFAQIESINLEFVMPEGYEGTALTTGNSSYWSQLSIGITDVNSSSIGFGELHNPPLALAITLFNLPADQTSEFAFPPYQVFSWDGEPLIPPTWPEFAFDGLGQVIFIDVNRSSFHPLPTGDAISSSTTWGDPGAIESVRLTIVGTPVPEPTAVSYLLLSGITLLGFVRCNR